MGRLLSLAAVLAAVSLNAEAQTFTIGNTTKLGYADSGNGNLMAGQGPYSIATSASLQSLSFWVSHAAGELVLGVYTAGPNNKCAGGSLVAQTAVFTPVSQSWNTKPPESPVTLPAGNYCLAYFPSSSSLSFRKGLINGIIDPVFGYTFGQGVMPPTFSTTPDQANGDGFSWSFYATLAPVSTTQTPVSVQFNPSTATVSDAASQGTVLAAVLVQTSDGNAFAGSGLSITTQTAPGMASLTSTSIPSNVQVASISSADDGQQSVTVQACENSVCVSGQLPVMVSSAPPPPTLSLAFNPASPSIPQDISPGAPVTVAVATWSNGATFTGTYAFSPPNQNDGGQFAIDPNSGAITVGPGGLPTSDENTTQNITVLATQ
jgi:hypothetical protein